MEQVPSRDCGGVEVLMGILPVPSLIAVEADSWFAATGQ